MSAQDRDTGGFALGVREPRRITLGRVINSALLGEFHGVIGSAKPESRARVDDDAKPVIAGKRRVPARRLIAVEVTQKIIVPGRVQHGFDLRRQHFGGRRRPRRQQTGVDEQQIAVAHDQRTRSQPGEQLVAVRSVEDAAESVLPMRASMSCRHGQQVQVVIAEHRYGGRAEALDRAQHGERIRTPIDEVANQP